VAGVTVTFVEFVCLYDWAAFVNVIIVEVRMQICTLLLISAYKVHSVYGTFLLVESPI